MQQLAAHTIIIAAENQVSCDVDDEAALLNLDTGVYYGLNPVGAYIWKLVQSPMTIGALRKKLQDEFEVDAADVEKDLSSFVEQMVAAGLVELQPDTPT
jgi:hypothetical protein